MDKLWNRLRSVFGGDKAAERVATGLNGNKDAEDNFWQEVYAARAAFYQTHFGPLPDDILKIAHLLGVWPGGGIFVVPADRLKPGARIYTTFGLSNPDMPTGVAATNISSTQDSQGRLAATQSTLREKSRTIAPAGAAGYGYEIAVVASEDATWPLGIVEWVAQAELCGDAGILERVRKYDGLTVERVQIGPSDWLNLLIANAVGPLPPGTTLPNGTMDLLVATTITDEEMAWSKTNGRGALLDRLVAGGVGQFSMRNRPSVLGIVTSADELSGDAPDLAEVVSRDVAEHHVAAGRLERIHLFPLELGGEDAAVNTVYGPIGTRAKKAAIDEMVRQRLVAGTVSQYSASPEYEGRSVVPARIRIRAWGADSKHAFETTLDIGNDGIVGSP
ncbi:hypothetical protein FIV34_09805 [Luteibacter pinisoli]|uniref:Uncharacterized protein n=1 Tax=Luteibacter pinisoli TaxID=2589080 RepID=A0A4Y5Z353_9GAMM|nr:suppressor of fused domain protein [Luteibacter pinisoli]QDE39474.1 hypothetical protein FIV34_09805 [Luteibacter pinisoli]